MEFEIYKNGSKSYLVFKPSLTEDAVKVLANKHFKTKRSDLVAKKCVVVRGTLYLEGGGHGTKVWAVWVER